ncbi:MAG: hypothetical protein ABSG76_14880 [Xanthobacteraceae bacterium]
MDAAEPAQRELDNRRLLDDRPVEVVVAEQLAEMGAAQRQVLEIAAEGRKNPRRTSSNFR